MKTRKVKVKRLGEIEFVYPQSDKDINNQINEIFHQEHYKLGRVKDGVVLDVGANVGLASTYFQDVAKQIYAFEPSPLFFEALMKNTERFKNVKIFNLGISYTNHQDTMFSITDNPEDIPATFFPSPHPKSTTFRGAPLNISINLATFKFIKFISLLLNSDLYCVTA